MSGIIFSIIAGAAMSIQGVFNTRLNESIGLYEANTFVQGTAFIFSFIAMLVLGKGDWSAIFSTNKLFLTGGIIGLLITITVMLAIEKQSPTVAISVILISQLIVAAIIDAFGLFGAEKVAFGLTKYIGIALMIAGIIVFKR